MRKTLTESTIFNEGRIFTSLFFGMGINSEKGNFCNVNIITKKGNENKYRVSVCGMKDDSDSGEVGAHCVPIEIEGIELPAKGPISAFNAHYGIVDKFKKKYFKE